jgi:hypothetical protein
MIQEKTRGNLTNEEATVLRNALSNLQMAYVEVAHGHGPQPAAPQPASQEQTAPPEPIASAESEADSKKKFTKSYGP